MKELVGRLLHKIGWLDYTTHTVGSIEELQMINDSCDGVMFEDNTRLTKEQLESGHYVYKSFIMTMRLPFHRPRMYASLRPMVSEEKTKEILINFIFGEQEDFDLGGEDNE